MTLKNREIIVRHLGLMDYKACWDYQEELFSSIISEKTANRSRPGSGRLPTRNYLLFVEHPHVYTLGKSGDEKNLLVTEAQLKMRNATYYRINRGGDITYHGPGQIVVYPILDLDNFFTDIHKYLRMLEECVILTLRDYGIAAGRSAGETGVWLDANDPKKARKICAMGVRCSRWVTMHGFAFNVDPDLSYFGNIIPCGINDKKVTSMAAELNTKISIEEVKPILLGHFTRLFEAACVHIGSEHSIS